MIEQLIKEHNARVGPPPPVPKEKWESDDEVSNCRSCSKSFGSVPHSLEGWLVERGSGEG